MAQTKGFSYDELVKPLESVQKAHNEVITDMASLSQNSEILDYYLDPSRDKESYNLYNKFKNELDFNVDDFARNGLTRNNGMKLLNLHRNYNNNVANILDAVKNREADRAEQQKLQEASKGQTIFGMNGTDGDANIRSVDYYLQGNKGFAHQNLDDVRDEAMKFAAAASKRKYKNSLDNPDTREMKAFANQYWRKFEETGYNDKESYNIIKELMNQYENAIGDNIDNIPDDHPAGFIKNMKRMLQERNIDQFSDKDKGRMIMAYINGIDEGLTYIPKDELKETADLKRAGRQNVNFTYKSGDGFTNPDKSRVVHDENAADSTFENSNKSDQENMTTNLLNNSNGMEGMTVAVNVGGQTLHRLSQLSDYLNATGCKLVTGKDKKGNSYAYYTYPNGGVGTQGMSTQKMYVNGAVKDVKVPNDIVKSYQDKVKSILSTYWFNTGDGSTIQTADYKTMINPKTSSEYLDYMLPRQMMINERDSKSHTFISTQLRINQSDKKAAVGNSLARLGKQGLYYNAKYNPKTRTWEMKRDQNDLFKSAILNTNLNDGCDISLVYLPQSKNDNEPLYVMVRTNAMAGNSRVPAVYIPLKHFTSSDDAKIANTMNDLAKNRRDIINRNIEILGIDSNVTISKMKELISEYKKIDDSDERNARLDSAYQIMESIEYIDYYLHKRNIISDSGNQANRKIKQVVDDLEQADTL